MFPGDEHSVRRALSSAMQAFGRMCLSEECLGTVEIVLAEVLNNVVEHAYAEHGRGVIELRVGLEQNGLAFCIRDDGAPMPDSSLPMGAAHDLDVAEQDLPEGGFGWFLIRELTEALSYRRIGNRNELRFRMTRTTAARAN